MSDPQALGRLSLAMQGASAVSNAAGTYANARNTQTVARANASIADQQAADALKRGQLAEWDVRRRGEAMKSSQRAAFAHGNLALDEGSPLDVLLSTEVMQGQDQLQVQENANNEANGFRMKAANLRAEADATNPFASTVSSLMGGASAVADKWYQYKKAWG